jgi:hypothetical protein
MQISQLLSEGRPIERLDLPAYHDRVQEAKKVAQKVWDYLVRHEIRYLA